MRLLTFAIVLSVAAGMTPRAEDGGDWKPPPEHLSIGYEGEGKVNASPEACRAFVKEMLEWPDDKIQIEVNEVCAARKRHVLAYDALQSSYSELRKELVAGHHGIDTGPTIKSFEDMIKNCVDHKFGLSDGGHNIRSDIIPNDDAATCLTIGKQLLDAEIVWFKTGFTVSHPAP
jgi:hypothetical protein